MEFGAPENLVYIWLVPLALVIAFFAEKMRKKRLRMIGLLGADRPIPVRLFKTIVKTTLISLALVSLVLALAKPRWGFEWIDAKQRGADIMIAVDVSKSMLAPDVSPSRLERAKRKISDLLDRMAGDRVGLVAFAGTSFVQCPLTQDYGAVRLFLSYLDPELIPTQGTDLGSAIDMSLAGLFDGSPEGNETGRAIILMTDGEDQEGRGLKSAELAKSKEVKIYTLGIGTEEGTLIPEAGGGFKKDRAGNLVISKPNEPALRALSKATGGSYIRSVADDSDIRFIYDNGILKEINREENQEIRSKRWHERFQWFLAASFIFLFCEPLIRDVRFTGLLVLGFIFLSPSTGFAASLGAAHKYYEQKDYEKAAKEFSEVEQEQPDNPDITYNRAVSQFRNGDFNGAAEGFGRSAGSDRTELQEKSWYNLGNSFANMQKFSEAINSYENALKINPENKKATENLALMKKLLEEQKKQPKQPDQNKDKNNDEKKEQDQQDQNKDQQEKDSQKKDQQEKDQQASQDKTGQKDDKPSEKPDDQQNPGADDKEKKPAEQQAQTGKDEKKEEEQPKQAENKSAETNHNQEESKTNLAEGKPLEQSREYTKDQALQLLRSVEDQIKKYKYLNQQGQEPKQDPEKDW